MGGGASRHRAPNRLEEPPTTGLAGALTPRASFGWGRGLARRRILPLPGTYGSSDLFGALATLGAVHFVVDGTSRCRATRPAHGAQLHDEQQ